MGPESNWFLGTAKNSTLRLNPTGPGSKPQKGGFKLAIFGTSTTPLAGDITVICAKQSYYVIEKVVEEKGALVEKQCNVPHDRFRQLQNLMMEIACLVWAQVLLDIVYQFIEEMIKTVRQPPFNIPSFRFVKSALAVKRSPQDTSTSRQDPGRVFLVEEVIQEKEEGRFRKYMNNVTPIPMLMDSETDKEAAEFFAFSQHVQYFKTKKLVFVSDYQGKLTHSRPGSLDSANYIDFQEEIHCSRTPKYLLMGEFQQIPDRFTY